MRAALTLVVSFLAVGCNDLFTETLGDAGPAPPTSVSMDPEAFLVGATCADLPGAMQSYVATITDVTDPHAPFTLPSSPPLPCSQSVYFEYVAVGHVYTGVIDGFTQQASDLVPACSRAGAGSACDGVSCPNAYGCPGTCDVTSFGTQDDGCLKTCGIDLSCLAQHPCVATTAAEYTSCVHACIKDPSVGMNTAIAEGCLANAENHSCLKQDVNKLEQLCPTVSTPGAGVKGCTCTYATANGDRHMTGTKPDSSLIAPRWTTPESVPCGHTPYGAATQPYINTGLTGCGQLEDHAMGSTPTAIQLVPASTLSGGLACYVAGVDAGAATVTTFDVTPSDPTLTPYTDLACSASESVTWSQGILDGAPYVFTVQAHETGASAATQEATCVATAEAGITVVAKCDPLAPIPGPKPPPPKKPKPAGRP